MKGVPLFLGSREKLETKTIAAAMFSSNSPEELLQVFLTNLGEELLVSRVAIYQFTSQYEGIVLLEAVAPNIQSIKNKIYPITYFGTDSLHKYPRDRAIAFADVSQITETLTVHQRWQNSQLRAMISAPIIFDEFPDPEINIDKIWGLAFVQQCDHPRQWHGREVDFLFELSQVLGQCLQAWNLHLRSPQSAQPQTAKPLEQEEFTAKRVESSQDLEFLVTELSSSTGADVAFFSNFTLSAENHNEILDRSHIKDSHATINQAVDLAMQTLEQKISSKPSSKISTDSDTAPTVIKEMNNFQEPYTINLESMTIVDTLENIGNGQNEQYSQLQTKAQIDYLQQKVEYLVEDMKQKLEEINCLQQQIKKLSTSQQEFRQVLFELQSENLPKHLQSAVIDMYLSLAQ